MTTTAALATQVYSIFIRATPDEIWDAITKPEFTAKYFYGTEIVSLFEVGSEYLAYMPGRENVMVDGEVLEVDPPTRLVHTWRALYDESSASEPHSRVTWEIAAQDGGYSVLTVTHDQLDNAPHTAESVSGGWMFVLSGLKTVLETGQPLVG